MSKPIAIYIHFPFCKKKCRYCDFLSFPVCKQTDIYINALINELLTVPAPLFEDNDYIITSIFIGGGTPSLMQPEQLTRLMTALWQYPVSKDAEITMEANPGTLTPGLLHTMRSSGINRLSIGLQSPDDETLSLLGRIHTYRQFEENYRAARAAGFKNINIDLMSALPGQSPESYEDGLLRVLNLKPEHISAYSLIIEEDTPFYDYYEKDKNIGIKLPPLPSEDNERLMYHRTKAILKTFGYERYEISNYAKKGFECRHNTAYWTRQDYLGLGLGAASMISNVRFSNTSDLNTYIRQFTIDTPECNTAIRQSGVGAASFDAGTSAVSAQNNSLYTDSCRDFHIDREFLSVNAQMEEFMFLGLRLTCGISTEAFKQLFKKDIFEVYGDVLHRRFKDGTLIFKAGSGCIALSEHGLDVSNMIMADFILD